jgi:tripartite-type tricarboxylate transporter receptor subunit TctC
VIPRRGLLATPLATPALAQSWPTRAVTLVVAFAAGGNEAAPPARKF